MEVVAHPSLIPTSQQAGTTSDNSEAMAPKQHAEIPVSTQQQPKIGVPLGQITWGPISGAM